jgi:pimeloyl-ACP methyl ester carboxylesterase/phosphohistidine swiveling domain-containing protein
MDEAGRPRLLIVGGNGSASSRFARVWPDLERWCRPRLVELAGQGGRCGASLPERFPGYVADLTAELRHAAAGERVICYGQGIGGLLLAHAVAGAPEIAERLILHAPVGAHLASRRLRPLLAWGPLGSCVRRLLGSSLLGPALATRFFESGGAVDGADRRAFAAGYRQARSFQPLFALTDPLAAMDGLDALTLPVTLLWGGRDNVVPAAHLPVWAERLAGALVTACIVPHWRHYPYMDRPAEFSAMLEVCHRALPAQGPVSLDDLTCFPARSKAGRLALMRASGLPVPPGWWIPQAALENGTAERLFVSLPSEGRYAARSSAAGEDQIGRTAAGVYESELEVAPAGLLEACGRVSGSGKAEYFAATGGAGEANTRCNVLVQEMAGRTAGGVAWVRALGADLEIAAGDFSRGVAGSEAVTRAALSTLGPPWTAVPDALPGGLSERLLWSGLWLLLRRAHALFGAGTLDMEWAYAPGAGFQILQARPVGERHPARRLLTAANLREVAPPEPSRFLLGTIEAVSQSLPRFYARFDGGIDAWQEPFTVTAAGRACINADFYAALMDRWGLPRSLVSRAIGGALPHRAWRPDRLLRSLPALARLATDWRRIYRLDAETLERLRRELEAAAGPGQLAAWFVQAFHSLVESMFRITGALAAGAPLWRGAAPDIATALMAADLRRAEASGEAQAWAEFYQSWGHRGEYESDPAVPRGDERPLCPHVAREPSRSDAGTDWSATRIPAEPRRLLPDPLSALPALLRHLPMLAPRHLQAHREWFKDSAMRLWAAFRARLMAEAALTVQHGILDRGEQIWDLTPLEIMALPAERWRDAAASGAAARPTITEAALFWSDTLEPYAASLSGSGGQAHQQRLPLVAGRVTGPAIVARTPSEALAVLAELAVDRSATGIAVGRPILLAPAVDPGWLPVFIQVAGVAAELGGRLSHAATLLRELGIPSVLNLAGVMSLVRNGETVELQVPPGDVRPLRGPDAQTAAAEPQIRPT